MSNTSDDFFSVSKSLAAGGATGALLALPEEAGACSCVCELPDWAQRAVARMLSGLNCLPGRIAA